MKLPHSELPNKIWFWQIGPADGTIGRHVANFFHIFPAKLNFRSFSGQRARMTRIASKLKGVYKFRRINTLRIQGRKSDTIFSVVYSGRKYLRLPTYLICTTYIYDFSWLSLRTHGAGLPTYPYLPKHLPTYLRRSTYNAKWKQHVKVAVRAGRAQDIHLYG